MPIHNPLRLGAYALLMSSVPAFALAQEADIELLPIDVAEENVAAATPSSSVILPEGQYSAPVADGGDLLSNVPGVSASRMGGHALDIIIRGQQGNQISVIDAGSITYGACPNRMDPPTATTGITRADRIVVERGYASVTNGPGATGGAVILERDAPEFEDDNRWSGNFTLGAASNSRTLDGSGNLSFDMGGGFYMELSADAKTAGNYSDGDGNEIRSAYDQMSGGITFGYDNNGFDMALDIERDEATGILFAGAGMDSPYSYTDVYRLRGGIDLDKGALTRIEGNLFLTSVDHLMDNYSLRNPTAMMGMSAPTSSETWGGQLEAHLDFGNVRAKVGIDHQSNNRMAEGYMGPIAQIEAQNPAFQVALSWPDVTIAQTGLYGEAEVDLNDRTMLKLGARYDYVKADAALAAVPTTGGMGMTANDFYTMQYGTTFDSPREEHNFGGLVRLEYELSQSSTLFAGLSRSVRTADTNERAMARSNWVGNPDINPEKHNQLDFGIETARDDWWFTASAYVDDVDDYILRDAFTAPGVTTYRNVSAFLAGVELAGAWERNGWIIAGDATYTYGQNKTDDRALAQIPPLFGKVEASYGQDAWRVGGRVNWVATQNRIDPARDPGKTDGWATLDVFGSYDLNDKATLFAGVNNITDKTYANHLARSNVFDPVLTQVNEPGRTVYVKLEARF